MNKKEAGLFIPNIAMPESCMACPIRKYDAKTGDVKCPSLGITVGTCILDDDNAYIGTVCSERYITCPLRECCLLNRW